jgi:DNA-binding winged helix-turn-helix (wHTH) protein/Flp pilus assembly protein TadD
MNYSLLVYEFGHFRLDVAERVLFCAGKPMRLTIKAFEVLLVLVENSGHLVTKDELMRRVWLDAVVEEGNLAQAVSALRKAFGESHRSHRNHEYIETIARRGYRFNAAVRVQDETRNSGSVAAAGVEVGETARLDASASGNLSKDHNVTNEADHLYRRGRYYWSKYTIDGLKNGIDHFRRAIAVDPDYSRAYVGLADCYYRLSNIYLPPGKAGPKAKQAVLKALELDETLTEAHSLLGLIRLFYDRNWPAAESEFKRAIDLTPGSAMAHKRYGWALGMLGQFDESVTEMNRALDLEPRSADIHVGMGIVLHLARLYDAAVGQAHLALDLEPDFFPARVVLGIAHAQQGQHAKALAELQNAAYLTNIPWTLGYLGYAYGISGKHRQALEVLAQLEKRSEQAYVSPFAMALVNAGLRQTEQALRSLEQAYEDRNELIGFLMSSPELDRLRSERRFAALLNRTKFAAMAA